MSDIKYTVIKPDSWVRPRGYSYAVSAEGMKRIYVAGQLGVENGKLPVATYHDFGQQWDLALGNVVQLVNAAGGTAQNVTVLRIYVTSIEEFNQSSAAVGTAWAQHFGSHFPALTLVEVSRLVDPRAKVEIEAEAVLA